MSGHPDGLSVQTGGGHHSLLESVRPSVRPPRKEKAQGSTAPRKSLDPVANGSRAQARHRVRPTEVLSAIRKTGRHSWNITVPKN